MIYSLDGPASPRNVIGAILPSRLFSFDKQTRNFTSEISTTPQVLRQLWNDSMDPGFGMKSEKTGKVVLFTLFRGNRDQDGDYTDWVFRVYNPCALPELENLSVTVFND